MTLKFERCFVLQSDQPCAWIEASCTNIDILTEANRKHCLDLLCFLYHFWNFRSAGRLFSNGQFVLQRTLKSIFAFVEESTLELAFAGKIYEAMLQEVIFSKILCLAVKLLFSRFLRGSSIIAPVMTSAMLLMRHLVKRNTTNGSIGGNVLVVFLIHFGSQLVDSAKTIFLEGEKRERKKIICNFNWKVEVKLLKTV